MTARGDGALTVLVAAQWGAASTHTDTFFRKADTGVHRRNLRRAIWNCQRGMDFSANFVHQMKTVKYHRQSIFEGVSCD